MGKFVLTDANIQINGTAVSDHANNLTMTDTADQIDFTTYGPAGYKQYGPGLKDCSIQVDFFSDFAAGAINSIIQPLYASGGTFTLQIKPTSQVTSATNPSATMTARLYNYSGINGAPTAASTFQCTFANAGTAGLVWGTV